MTLLRASWAFVDGPARARRWRQGASFGPRLAVDPTLAPDSRAAVAPMARWVRFHVGPARHVLQQVARGAALLDPPVDASRGPRAAALSPPPVGPRVSVVDPQRLGVPRGPAPTHRAPPAPPAPASEPPPGMMLDPFAGLAGILSD